MKLRQNQVWKQGELYFRIVRLDRLSVEFKEMAAPSTREGTHHTSSKKEFCRIIKGASLLGDSGGGKLATDQPCKLKFPRQKAN